MTEPIVSRSQQALQDAHRRVTSVAVLYPIRSQDEEKKRRKNEKARKNYGSLCHSFPVLVLRDGLCQTLSFYEAKKKERDDQFDLALRHIREILGLQTADGDASFQVAQFPIDRYMRETTRLLDAWIYHKRFAESILKVGSATEGEAE